MKKKTRPWPKRIQSWAQIWNAAIRWRPNYKISYGARPKPRYYVAEGGPYDGRVLALVDGTTATIRVQRDKYNSEWRGRYVCGLVATRGERSYDYGTTVWRNA